MSTSPIPLPEPTILGWNTGGMCEPDEPIKGYTAEQMRSALAAERQAREAAEARANAYAEAFEAITETDIQSAEKWIAEHIRAMAFIPADVHHLANLFLHMAREVRAARASLPSHPPASRVARQMRVIRQLLPEHEGEFALFSPDDACAGLYDTYEKTLTAGYDQFGLGHFMYAKIERAGLEWLDARDAADAEYASWQPAQSQCADGRTAPAEGLGSDNQVPEAMAAQPAATPVAPHKMIGGGSYAEGFRDGQLAATPVAKQDVEDTALQARAEAAEAMHREAFYIAIHHQRRAETAEAQAEVLRSALEELVAADDAHQAWCEVQRRKPRPAFDSMTLSSISSPKEEDPERAAIITRLRAAWEAARAALQGLQEAAPRWPKERCVGRMGEMAPPGRSTLRVMFDSDNDVLLEVYDAERDAEYAQRAGIEFCTVGSGGGHSPRTRMALIALMCAIEDDNAESPTRAFPPLERKSI